MKEWGMATRALHVGEEFNPTRAHAFPIFQTGTFVFETLEEAEKVFKGELGEYCYTRIDNPNFREVEEKIASLEGSEGALFFPSGMSAIYALITYLTEKDNLLRLRKSWLISTKTLYGCTDRLFTFYFPRRGVKVKLIDTTSLEKVHESIYGVFRKGAKRIIVFLETPANPTLAISDIAGIAKIVDQAKKNLGIEMFLIVDNTFASPYNQRPLELGADFVIQSVTKYLNGHGDLISGVVVAKDLQLLKELDDSLAAFRSFSGLISNPFECKLITRGLETFVLRMERHNSNARRLAQFLEKHPAVKRVCYPGYSGMVSFELKGHLKEVRKFFKGLEGTIIKNAVSLGYTTTLIECPALMTHALIPRRERLKKGITDTLIRLSVGLEDYEDLERVLKRALDGVKS